MAAATTLKKIWRNEYFQTAIMIILIIVIVFGFWYGSQLVLNTNYPAMAVASGSMCTLPGSYCDGWSHPFEHTLHVGDLIIVQGVNHSDIRAEPYPNGDIIVFRNPDYPADSIVHRAIEKATAPNGKIYFKTKGDGNPSADQWVSHIPENTWSGMVSEDLVIGKVILRIPWVGHIALYMRNSSGILLIIALIIIIVILEFVIPAFMKEEGQIEPKESVEKASET